MKQVIDAPAIKKWHKTRILPQISDTDYGGGIYHGKYFALYNQARDLFLEDLGIPYLSLMNQGLNLSVAELHTRFHKPVFYGDMIMVHTRISWVRNQSFGVIQKMICIYPDDKSHILKNQVELNLVCTHGETGAVPLPKRFKDAVQAYYKELPSFQSETGQAQGPGESSI